MKTFLLCLFCIPLIAFAQTPDTHVIYETFGAMPKQLFKADLDNDGKQDVIAWTDKTLYCFKGKLAGLLPAEIIDSGNDYLIKQVVAADVNMDGDNDIVMFEGAPADLVILTNPGSIDGVWTRTSVPGSFGYLIGVFDINSDTIPDLVYETPLGQFTYRHGNGTGFNASVVLTDPYPAMVRHTLSDADNDGLMDILAFYNTYFTYQHNNGNNTFSANVINVFEANDAMDMADINMDGYEDVLYAVGPELRAAMFDPYDMNFSPDIYKGFLPYNITSVRADDLDGDGDDDWMFTLFTGIKNRIYTIETTDSTSFIGGQEVLKDYTTANVITYKMDADIYPDLVVFDPADPVYHVATDSMTWSNYGSDFHIGNSEIKALNTADYNNDGTLDFLVGAVDGTIKFLNFDPATDNITFSQQLPPVPGKFGVKHLNSADFDNDGDTDVFACFMRNGGSGATYYAFENTGAGNFTYTFIDSADCNRSWLIDVDSDGDKDLITQSSTGNHDINLYIASDSGYAAPQLLSTGSVSAVAFGDIDNDGDVDMAAAYLSSYHIYWRQYNAGFNTEVLLATSPFYTYPRSLNILDIDADGDNDLETRSTSYTYKVINTGGSYTFATWGSSPAPDMNNQTLITMEDVNNDSYPDFIYSDPNLTTVKLSWGYAKYLSGLLNCNTDNSIFVDADATIIKDVLSTNASQCYITYNNVPNYFTILIDTFSVDHATEGSTDLTLTFTATTIPTTPKALIVDPDAVFNVGAGYGTPYVINFPADSSALNPVTITFNSIDDLLPEAVDPTSNIITCDIMPGFTDANINQIKTIDLVDNDLSIISGAASATITEDSYVYHLHYKSNVAPHSPIVVTVETGEPLTTAGGLGASFSFTIPAGTDALDTIFDFDIWYENDYIEKPTEHITLNFSCVSADTLYNGLTGDAQLLHCYDNDYIGIARESSNESWYIEGIDTMHIYFLPLTALELPVSIIATPNWEIDLGNGPGNPVEITFNPCDSLPEVGEIKGVGYNDGLLEGLHSGTIAFDVVSDIEAYDALVFSDLEFFIDEATTDIHSQPAQQLQVYPSAGNGIFTITGVENSFITTVQVIDMIGRTIAEQQLSADGILDLTALAAGQYLLVVNNGANAQTLRISKTN